MSLRRRVETDAPKTEDPYGCPRDGGSPRRSIQTDVHETEDPGGSPRDGQPGRTGTEMSLRLKVKTDESAVLTFRLRDIHVCHLPWPYISETDVADGCP